MRRSRLQLAEGGRLEHLSKAARHSFAFVRVPCAKRRPAAQLPWLKGKRALAVAERREERRMLLRYDANVQADREAVAHAWLKRAKCQIARLAILAETRSLACQRQSGGEDHGSRPCQGTPPVPLPALQQSEDRA